jgi:hypothetical protein
VSRNEDNCGGGGGREGEGGEVEGQDEMKQDIYVSERTYAI